MATTCYTSYDLPSHHHSLRTIHPDTKVLSISVPTMIKEPHHQKDFTRPLHVDCSVEYELPNQAKPPQGVQNEPLLMIHPCYFRKIESQRQNLFVNNMPSISETPRVRVNTRGGASCSQYQPDVSQQAATPYQRVTDQQLWETPKQLLTNYRGLNADSICATVGINDRWACTPTPTDLSSRSPDRPEIRISKHRQYLRPRRSQHPYDVSAGVIPVASIFPHQHVTNQIHQQVCYNV